MSGQRECGCPHEPHPPGHCKACGENYNAIERFPDRYRGKLPPTECAADRLRRES